MRLCPRHRLGLSTQCGCVVWKMEGAFLLIQFRSVMRIGEVFLESSDEKVCMTLLVSFAVADQPDAAERWEKAQKFGRRVEVLFKQLERRNTLFVNDLCRHLRPMYTSPDMSLRTLSRCARVVLKILAYQVNGKPSL